MSEDNKELVVLVSKAPEDPEEKELWVSSMVRLQIAMWVDGSLSCAHCGQVFTSVDDFLARRPRRGYSSKHEEQFVDSDCWTTYLETQPNAL